MSERRQTFPTPERLTKALDENPFTDLIEKFYGRYDGSSEILDEIQADLLEHPQLIQLKQTLAEEHPAYTTVYRYDPYTVRSSGDRGGCFGYDQSYGASTAYLRLFESLQPDSILTIRTEDEVMAIISQPSKLLVHGNVMPQSDDPTILFTSKLFENFGSTINRKEEKEFGLLINHGHNLTKASPPIRLVSSSMQAGYFGQFRRRAKD